ncbi:hypothetical protein PVAP13_9NG671000 [Panicum virgatum]|uniref:Uncharacterized protein n=1 Tax=Panicum virgatum TaxID=38727 RepID=A0A8T0MXY3_PANVG|nr:hypothetical protein PVAP13_9NG671000 [Panicum virgatum]
MCLGRQALDDVVLNNRPPVSHAQIIGLYIGLLEEWAERFLKCHVLYILLYLVLFSFYTAYIEFHLKCWAYHHNNPIIGLINGSYFAERNVTDNSKFSIYSWQQVRFAFCLLEL